MTTQEINIAIAQICGWAWVHAHEWCWEHKDGSRVKRIPNYHSDLNACATFEAGLTRQESMDYQNWLVELVGRDSPSLAECSNGRASYASRWTWHATAPQRCEAFLRIRNRWIETEAPTK